ncbi:proline racemase family protein [Polyangium sp. 15x6]|uniref:proline racemase family protein n=1 Tax=Polyangium sp. 15x6 TaxID=3042687 RepID=UPI002499B68F|nr:proline racemase family protein [Polyangium sp. 15x6]MDI3285595.1 proline racemase family protein [Polyangium sp. 15x6]
MARFSHVISAIDSHTGGEPTRIVLSGLPHLPGGTMAAKKRHMEEHLDHFRTLLMREPRGHHDMFGAILTPPVGEHSHHGLLFMDHAGYLDMCGHGVIGVATVLIELGMIAATEPETVVVFDTPAGVVEGHARVEAGRVVEVAVANVPSFVYERQVELTLPGVGVIDVDVSFGGNFFAMVDASKLGVPIHRDHIPRLIELGMMVKDAVNEKVKVQHPAKPDIDRVELTEIYERPEPTTPFSRSMVVFGRGQLDRCPCGTGLSALMATLHDRGELPLGVELVDEGIIGTRFKGRLTRELQVGGSRAVRPILVGRAYVTGIQQFVVDPDDPLKYGFVVGR